ncbi:hypothetical protein IV203_012133 [Nitzschia inconspicua]|uniref:Uncharacterized protein n=1 Tax=Nitzschia inconspicua TaxID=303405 RepID=A0A9K3KTZ9_9STRA|nr:hypothetical protein IV203_012133 [Nitzschia inconspicua]
MKISFAKCIPNAFQMHSKCISVCMEADRSPSRQKASKNYLPYKKTRDLIVTDPCPPADHILTDNSIETIIIAMWEVPDYTNFSNDICEKRHHASSLVTKMEETFTWLLLSLDPQTVLSSLPTNPMATSSRITLL